MTRLWDQLTLAAKSDYKLAAKPELKCNAAVAGTFKGTGVQYGAEHNVAMGEENKLTHSNTTFYATHEAGQRISAAEFKYNHNPASIAARMCFLMGQGDHSWRFMLSSSGMATLGFKWNPLKNCDAFIHGKMNMNGFATGSATELP